MKKIWMTKTEKSNGNSARDALFSKEIADDLMAQITGGQGKSGCHANLNIASFATVSLSARSFAV